MPLHLAWPEIALRLTLAALASAVIGVNRGEQDRPVGLRTTMLVTLAATIAMIQVNLLLPVSGKAQDSFVVMDLMRLPLGILSGMGFIGAGAIIRRDDLVKGVTTAATLWFATVMGLCFGAGQILLGLAALGLAVLVLWPLKWAEHAAGLWRRAKFSVSVEGDDPIEDIILSRWKEACFACSQPIVALTELGTRRTVRCTIRWHEGRVSELPLDFTRDLGRYPGVTKVEWWPLGDH